MYIAAFMSEPLSLLNMISIRNPQSPPSQISNNPPPPSPHLKNMPPIMSKRSN